MGSLHACSHIQVPSSCLLSALHWGRKHTLLGGWDTLLFSLVIPLNPFLHHWGYLNFEWCTSFYCLYWSDLDQSNTAQGDTEQVMDYRNQTVVGAVEQSVVLNLLMTLELFRSARLAVRKERQTWMRTETNWTMQGQTRTLRTNHKPDQPHYLQLCCY